MDTQHWLIFAGVTLLVLIPVGFVLLVLFLSMWEKTYVQGDLEPCFTRPPYEELPYFIACKDEALANGLIHMGDFSTRADASLVKGLASIWVSEDRQTLLEIVAAKSIAGVLRRVTFWSRRSDGQMIKTADETGLVDLSNFTDLEVVYFQPFKMVLDTHLDRVRHDEDLVPFGRDALAEIERIDTERGERYVKNGLAKWVTVQRGKCYRFTLRGSIISLFNSFFRQAGNMQSQQDRVNDPRPGDKRYRPIPPTKGEL